MKASALLVVASLFAAPAMAQYRADQPPAAGERHDAKKAAKDAALTTKVHTALASDVGL